MADSQLFEIILIATITAVILFRLYSVLGRRTGNEHAPDDYRLPPRPTAGPYAPEPAATLSPPRPLDRPADPVMRGMFDISLADRTFDKDKFLSGARTAYEMIENAFANGDLATLRPLLSDPVYDAFAAALRQRQRDKQTASFTFIGFKDVKIVAAALKGQTAEITVRFETQFISATRDAAGQVVAGDDKSVQQVCDIWTFVRETRTRNPNWLLTATASEAA